MNFKFFTIPVQSPDSATADLNRFLAGHAVLGIERHFVADGQNSLWAICVNYQPSGEVTDSKAGKVDYKEVLDEKQFAVYARLRDLRKQLAEQDGVPVYSVLNNRQLAEMVQQRVTSKTVLKNISGVGEARANVSGARSFAAIVCCPARSA